MKISHPYMIGDQNKYDILNLIKEKDGILRQDIAKSLNLSVTAVSKNVNILIAAGIIREAGTDDSHMGRKPTLLKYNSNIMNVLGIELMPQGFRGAISDLSGDILFWHELPSRIEEGVGSALSQLDELIRVLCSNQTSEDVVTAVCIATPGFTGKKIDFNLLSTFVEEWNEIDLENYIERKFGLPAVTMNDVELGLIGECWRGAGRDYKNILFIKYGDGLACRSMVDGVLISGKNGAAGEIGYYLSNIKDVREKFYYPGVAERKLSKDIFSKYNSETSAKGKDEKVRFLSLLKKANEGDVRAEEIITEIVDDISIIINNTSLVLDPEIVILGGDAAYFRDCDIDRINSVLTRTCPFVPEIKVSELEQNSGVIGSIKVAISRAEEELVYLWR